MGRQRRSLVLVCVSALALGSPAAAAPSGQLTAVSEVDVQATVSAMSLEEKVGQLIMAQVGGKRPQDGAADLVRRNHLGGVVLTRQNVGSPEQVRAFTAGLQAATTRVPLLVSVDHEGGTVLRFGPPVTQLPSACTLGVTRDPVLARESGRVAGRELLAMGINMNLAPVLDVNDEPGNPIIGTRSIGPDADLVAGLGAAYISGLRAERVVSTAKHFPGHGSTTADSHYMLPVVRKSRTELDAVELAPFRRAVADGVDVIMTAHVLYPALDRARPATLSRAVITELLRTELGFDGIVITDSIGMGAIARWWPRMEAAVLAVQAGADMVLIGSGATELHAALMEAVRSGRISLKRLDASVTRIVRLKLARAAAWRDQPPLTDVGAPTHRAVADTIGARADLMPDTGPPRAGAPRARLGEVSAIGPSTVPVVISWAGSDDHCVITGYQLDERVDGGTWRPVALSGNTGSVLRPFTPWRRYSYRLRAADPTGRWGDWVVSETFWIELREETDPSITYTGAWSRVPSPHSLGEYVQQTRASGATATVTFHGRGVAYLAARGPLQSRGHASADGLRRSFFDLNSQRWRYREVIVRGAWDTDGLHSLAVSLAGTAGRPSGSVDAFLILRGRPAQTP